MATTRQDTEKARHNVFYARGTRDGLGKFYDVTMRSDVYFKSLLRRYGAGRRVLEYGCGTGSSGFYLAGLGADVTGIDISEAAIARAQQQADEQRLSSLSFQVMDAEALSFADDTFDLVCGTGILHHLDRRAAPAEICRTLKPGGVAIFREPLGHNPLLNAFRKLTPHLRSEECKPFTMAELRQVCAPFDDPSVQYFHAVGLFAYPFRPLPVFPTILRAFDAADRTLFAAAPATRKLAWQAVIVLRRPRKGAASQPPSETTGRER